MAHLSSGRPEPTTILAVTAWRDSKYAATGVAVELAMDNNLLWLEFNSPMPLQKSTFFSYFLDDFSKDKKIRKI